MADKENKNIAVIGNSVAMRVRPPMDFPENKNYSVLLRDDGFQMQNLAKGGNTIKSALKELDSIVSAFPDIYILNFGVVDASNREIPRWFFNLVNSSGQAWYNRFSSFIYNGFIKRIRRQLVFLRGKRPWVRKKAFRKYLTYMLDRLQKETNANIIGLSINLANDRVEKALPGSRKNHRAYNKILSEALKGKRCTFLDLTDLESEKYYPDGVHFSAEGHKIVSQRIVDTLQKF
jgi:lysophospholipase L1-like esterase